MKERPRDVGVGSHVRQRSVHLFVHSNLTGRFRLSCSLSSSTRLRLSYDQVVVGLYSVSNALIHFVSQILLKGNIYSPSTAIRYHLVIPRGQHPEPNVFIQPLAEQYPHPSLKSRYNERLRQRALTVRRARRKRICESTMCSRCTIFLIANVKPEIRSESSL